MIIISNVIENFNHHTLQRVVDPMVLGLWQKRYFDADKARS